MSLHRNWQIYDNKCLPALVRLSALVNPIITWLENMWFTPASVSMDLSSQSSISWKKKDKPICGQCEWTAASQWCPGCYFHNIMISFVQMQTFRSHYISHFEALCTVGSWIEAVSRSNTEKTPVTDEAVIGVPTRSSCNYTHNLWSK